MFRPLSIELNKKLSKGDRQAQGIFFTPKAARDALFAALPNFTPSVILEPSFGSGEFLDDARARWPSAKVIGVEFNETILKAYKNTPGSLSTVECADFTKWQGGVADLILGNPPYLVTKNKIPACMTGRPNLYVEFIYKCFTQHLAPGGILAFILPTSFLNSSYYEPMRKILAEKSKILAVKDLDASFYETSQPTFLLVVQNTLPSENPFLLHLAGSVYLNPNTSRIQELLKETKTLASMGFSVKTGSVVWNQVSHIEGVEAVKKSASIQKGDLVKEGGTMLYYSNNLGDGQTVPMKDELLKKQYLKDFCRPPSKGPAILVSRGYGNTYLFNFTVIPDNREFYAENHVNVITGDVKKFGKVILSLKHEKTAEFIKLFVGNGGLSKSELEGVLPIF